MAMRQKARRCSHCDGCGEVVDLYPTLFKNKGRVMFDMRLNVMTVCKKCSGTGFIKTKN